MATKTIAGVAPSLKVNLPSFPLEAGMCNAFHIDKTALHGYYICTFALVIREQVVKRWAAAIQTQSVVVMKSPLLDFLRRATILVNVPGFKQPSVPINVPPEPPFPVDLFNLSQQGHNAEFSFSFWSWQAATEAVQQNSLRATQPKPIQGQLYLVLRCPISLQLAWINDLYTTDATGRGSEPEFKA
jgi:hypothetical protein